MQDYRKIRVWERAHHFALDVRRATRDFPRTGFGELKSQMIRAAESIAANIVEGSAAASRKEFARFIDVSIKSSSEVEYFLLLAKDNRVVRERVWETLTNEVVEIRKMLSAFRRALLASDEGDGDE
jgi:four helix bundle protein